MNDAIEVSHLRKEFADIQKNGIIKLITNHTSNTVVLDDITFSVPKGEIIGVIGKNGSGKSTLLRVLAGVYHSSSGIIHLNGTPSTLFEMGVFMDVYATGRSYCEDYYEFMHINKKNIPAMIDFVLDFTELGEKFDQPVYQYSAGMKARLLFAVTASMPAKIYLIDEALVVGDQYFQNKAWKRLFYLLGQGASGILVTHDFFSLRRLCTHTVVIKNGKISYCGETENAIRKYLNIKNNQLVDSKIQIELPFERNTFHEVHAICGAPFVFPYKINVKKLPDFSDVCISLHIEKKKQYGGNISVATVEQYLDLKHTGTFSLELNIDHFNLGPGKYVMNLTLGYIPKNSYEYYKEIYDEWKDISLSIEDPSGSVNPIEESPLMVANLKWRILCE